jgi:hypothetical protein
MTRSTLRSPNPKVAKNGLLTVEDSRGTKKLSARLQTYVAPRRFGAIMKI